MFTKVIYLLKLIYLSLILFSTATVFPQSSEAATSTDSTKPEYLFLGNEILPPMSYTKGNKRIGIVVDLAEAIKQRMNLSIRIDYMNWSKAQQMVLEESADALLQINPSEERKQIYDFSTPLLESEFSIFIESNLMGIVDINSLNGLRVGVENMGLPIEIVKEHPLVHIVEIPDIKSGFHLLVDHKIDAIIVDRWVGSFIIAENNLRGIKISGVPIEKSTSAIAVKKGNTVLLDSINRALDEIRKDGTYAKILAKWEPKEIIFQTKDQYFRQIVILVAILSVLLIMIISSIFLLIEVKKRRRSEKSLQKSERRYYSLITNLDAGVVVHAPDTSIVMNNPRASELLGLSDNQMKGKKTINPAWEFVDEEKTPLPLEEYPVNRIRTNNKPILNQILGIQRPGTNDILWITVNGIPIFDSKGDLSEIVISFIDITEHKMKEEILSNSRFPSENPNPVMRLSKEGSLLNANVASMPLLEEWGYDENIGISDGWKQIFKDVLNSGINRKIEVPCGERLFSFNFTPIVKMEYVNAYGFDITERKQAEMLLKEAAWRMKAIIEGTHVGTWEWNVQTGETQFNEIWAEILGYTLDELAPISIKTWQTVCHPDDLKQSDIILNQHFIGKLPYYNFESRVKHKDGHWVWVLDRGKVITWTEDDKPLMMFGTHTDISERKQMEAEQEKLQKVLNQRSKMEAIGQLAGGVAHEINNVLFGIMSATQLLQLPQRNLDESSLKYTDLIIQSSTRAKDLVTKLMAFGRKGKVVTTDVNIHKILDEITEFLYKTIDKKISISLTKNASKPIIFADYSAIENVIIELSVNAAHSMPEGGVMQIFTENITLNQSYCETSLFKIEPGDYIEIDVRDSGTGISPEDMNKIFEPFFTTIEFKNGTGLGLPSVYGTVHDHHGEIKVESEVGVGTSFKILLPNVQDTEEKKLEEIRHDKGQGLILFVDDEDINRILGKEILESLGYEVLLAKNGRESIDVYKKNHSEINLVILDMIMPEMNGSEAFLKIKEINKNCKVIISSGDTKNEKIDELMTLGLKGFIYKPYKIDELNTLLDRVLLVRE